MDLNAIFVLAEHLGRDPEAARAIQKAHVRGHWSHHRITKRAFYVGDHEDGRPKTPDTPEDNILRGNRAIRWAMEHRHDVHNAMHHPHLGWIDFPWQVQHAGKGIGGIQHIIQRRKALGQSMEHVLAAIPQAIQRGAVSHPYGHPWPRVEITHKEWGVVIRLDRDGTDGRWLLSGYELTEGGSR